MAISTYAELKTAVAEWGNRTDLTTQIPDFIALAEERINAKLRVRQMVARATTDAAEYLDLPDDWIEAREVKLTNSKTTVLDYYSPIALDKQFPYGGAGQPSGFTIVGSQLRLMPAPSGSMTAEIGYYQKVPALSDSQTQNAVLTDFPRVYLYGSLVEMQNYLLDAKTLQRFEALFDEAVRVANTANKSSTHAGGSLRVTPGGNVV
jgi:hypothetical protein